MQNPGRGRRVVAAFVLALVCAALAPAAAGADTISFRGGTGPEYEPFIDGFPNESYSRKVPITLNWTGSDHLVAGTEARLSPGPLAPAWTAGDVTIDVPSDWGMGKTVVVDAVVTYTTGSAIFPTEEHHLVWNPAAVSCTLGGQGCLTVDGDRRIDVRAKPHNVENFNVDVGVVDANLTWDHSPEHLQLTHYRLIRFRVGGGEPVKSVTLSPTDTTSYTDEGLTPDTLYCWRLGVQKIILHPPFGSEVLPGPEPEPQVCLQTAKNPEPPASGVEGAAPATDGYVDLAWGASPDGSVRYDLQHRDENDGEWSDLATGLTLTSHSFDEAEGTWRYRVRATNDDRGVSGWVENTDTVKVDRSGPTAPQATADREPDYGDWFKDSVAVSFDGSTDPDLLDLSDGTGVASYSAPDVLTASGTASGHATDAVGNESAAGTLDVKVDATAPTAELTCPSGLIVGQPGATASWTATDGQSGPRTSSDAVALDTSKPGTFPVTGPPPVDNVGHTGLAPSCTYTVSYRFTGFLSPINGDAVNVGKAGKTYPVKWRLQRYDGSLISDADAQALVSEMTAGQKPSDCTWSLGQNDYLEESSTGATELRYDSAADQFIYNYKAPSTLNCYVLGIRNADGANTKQVNFKFTK